MSDAVRESGVPPSSPPHLQFTPQNVVQDCQRMERRLKAYERLSIGTIAVSPLAFGASHCTHYLSSGNWGEGLAPSNLKTVLGPVLRLFSGSPLFSPSPPSPKGPPDVGTGALTVVAVTALVTSLILSAGHANLQAEYDDKCQGFIRERNFASVSPPKNVDESDFVAIEPIGRPEIILVPNLAAMDRVRPASEPSSPWIDGALRFARRNPEVAVGAMVLTAVVVGAAIYFSGGTVLALLVW